MSTVCVMADSENAVGITLVDTQVWTTTDYLNKPAYLTVVGDDGAQLRHFVFVSPQLVKIDNHILTFEALADAGSGIMNRFQKYYIEITL